MVDSGHDTKITLKTILAYFRYRWLCFNTLHRSKGTIKIPLENLKGSYQDVCVFKIAQKSLSITDIWLPR